MILTSLQKLPNNVGNLGKIIVATGFEWLSKVQKLPNLVTLMGIDSQFLILGTLIGQWGWLFHFTFLVVLVYISKSQPLIEVV